MWNTFTHDSNWMYNTSYLIHYDFSEKKLMHFFKILNCFRNPEIRNSFISYPRKFNLSIKSLHFVLLFIIV